MVLMKLQFLRCDLIRDSLKANGGWKTRSRICFWWILINFYGALSHTKEYILKLNARFSGERKLCREKGFRELEANETPGRCRISSVEIFKTKSCHCASCWWMNKSVNAALTKLENFRNYIKTGNQEPFRQKTLSLDVCLLWFNFIAGFAGFTVKCCCQPKWQRKPLGPQFLGSKARWIFVCVASALWAMRIVHLQLQEMGKNVCRSFWWHSRSDWRFSTSSNVGKCLQTSQNSSHANAFSRLMKIAGSFYCESSHANASRQAANP